MTEGQPVEAMARRCRSGDGPAVEAGAAVPDGEVASIRPAAERRERPAGPWGIGKLGRKVRAVNDRYRKDQPLPAYAALVGTYCATVTSLVAVARVRGALPTRVSAPDIALYSLATHKVTRILAKDPITSPLRAPFTQLRDVTGPAELREEVTGAGWRRAVGELLTCPFCLGQWVGTAFIFGGVLMPRTTRVVAATFAVHAASDVLHFAYVALEERAG